MEVQEGEGWRLVFDDRRQPFSMLLGGQDWSAEFTAAEMALLQRGVRELLAQRQALADQLMAEEALTLEWESGGLWLALEAGAGEPSLRFILTAAERRSLEAGWTGAAATAVAATLVALNRGDDGDGIPIDQQL